MKKMLSFFLILGFSILFISCGDESPAHDESGDDREIVDIQDDETDLGNSDDTGDIENTDNEEPDVEKNDEDNCGIPPSINDITDPVEGYESYFAFAGNGIINSADIETRPEAVLMSKMTLKLEDYPLRVLSQSYKFYMEDPNDPDGPALTLNVYGDPDDDAYSTLVTTSLPLEWIDVLKEARVEEAPFSTMVQVYSIRAITEDVSEVCTIAVSTFADYDGNELPEGKFHLCHYCNETFAPGEILYFGVNARLTTDLDTIVETLPELDSTEELCDCVDGEGHVTDCPEEN